MPNRPRPVVVPFRKPDDTRLFRFKVSGPGVVELRLPSTFEGSAKDIDVRVKPSDAALPLKQSG